jgi:hypothetical protein
MLNLSPAMYKVLGMVLFATILAGELSGVRPTVSLGRAAVAVAGVLGLMALWKRIYRRILAPAIAHGNGRMLSASKTTDT